MVTRKRCYLCNHEERDNIEDMLENMQVNPDDIDKEYGWASGTTSRHQRNHMGNYHNSSNPRCPFCTSPVRADIEERINDGRLSPSDAAKMLLCSEQQVLRHISNHLQPLVQTSAANIIAKKQVDEIATLEYSINRLDSKLDELFNEGGTDPKYIDSLTKLAREVRESLKYIMEFKGKLVHRRQDTIIVAQMQIVQEVLAQNHPEVWLDVRSKMEEKLQ